MGTSALELFHTALYGSRRTWDVGKRLPEDRHFKAQLSLSQL